MSNYYLSHSAAELDEAVEKVLTGYKDVSSVTATGNDVVIGKTIVDSSGKVINGSLNTDQFYSEGYTAGVIDGNNTSYSRGYDDGYDTGYDKGLEEATPTLQSKEVIPSLVEQTITADTGFDGLLSVLVNAIPQDILDAEYQKGYDEAFELYKPYKQELSYIQATGTQHIDTEYKFTSSNIKIECKWKDNVTPSVAVLFGTGADGTSSTSKGFLALYEDDLYIGSGSTGLVSTLSISNTSVTHELVLEIKSNNTWSYTLDGVTKSGTYTGAINQIYSLYLFNQNPHDNRPRKANLYYFKMQDNGVSVRDYIPVLDWDNVPCLYDKVKRKKHYNAGSGTFTYA